MADVVKIVNTGLAIITGRIAGSTGITEPKYVHWGTSTAAAVTSTQAALLTPATEARVAGTPTRELTTVADDTYQVVATLTNGSTAAKTITEAGLFISTTGAMKLRGTFTGIALSTGDGIQFTIKTAYADGST